MNIALLFSSVLLLTNWPGMAMNRDLRDAIKRLEAEVKLLEAKVKELEHPWLRVRGDTMNQRNDEITGRPAHLKRNA